MRRDGGALLRQKVKEKKRRQRGRTSKQACSRRAWSGAFRGVWLQTSQPCAAWVRVVAGGAAGTGKGVGNICLQGEERLKWAKTEMSRAIRE